MMGARSVNSDLVNRKREATTGVPAQTCEEKRACATETLLHKSAVRDVSHRRRSGELIDRGARLRYIKGT